MTNQEKEIMVLDVLLTKRKGQRIFIYGIVMLMIAWIFLLLCQQGSLILYTLPVIAVLYLVQYYYAKKSKSLSHMYAQALKRENDRQD